MVQTAVPSEYLLSGEILYIFSSNNDCQENNFTGNERIKVWADYC